MKQASELTVRCHRDGHCNTDIGTTAQQMLLPSHFVWEGHIISPLAECLLPDQTGSAAKYMAELLRNG